MRSASKGSHVRSIRPERLGWRASSRGASSCREVATVIRAPGWFSRMRINSREAYPDAPTIATPIIPVPFALSSARARTRNTPPGPRPTPRPTPRGPSGRRGHRSPSARSTHRGRGPPPPARPPPRAPPPEDTRDGRRVHAPLPSPVGAPLRVGQLRDDHDRRPLGVDVEFQPLGARRPDLQGEGMFEDGKDVSRVAGRRLEDRGDPTRGQGDEPGPRARRLGMPEGERRRPRPILGHPGGSVQPSGQDGIADRLQRLPAGNAGGPGRELGASRAGRTPGRPSPWPGARR